MSFTVSSGQCWRPGPGAWMKEESKGLGQCAHPKPGCPLHDHLLSMWNPLLRPAQASSPIRAPSWVHKGPKTGQGASFARRPSFNKQAGAPTQDGPAVERKGGLTLPHHIAARNSKEAQPASSILALGHHEYSPRAQKGSDFHSYQFVSPIYNFAYGDNSMGLLVCSRPRPLSC